MHTRIVGRCSHIAQIYPIVSGKMYQIELFKYTQQYIFNTPQVIIIAMKFFLK